MCERSALPDVGHYVVFMFVLERSGKIWTVLEGSRIFHELVYYAVVFEIKSLQQ